MELSISVEGDDAVRDAESLKNFLENRSAKGLNEVEMARSQHEQGEQVLPAHSAPLCLSRRRAHPGLAAPRSLTVRAEGRRRRRKVQH